MNLASTVNIDTLRQKSGLPDEWSLRLEDMRSLPVVIATVTKMRGKGKTSKAHQFPTETTVDGETVGTQWVDDIISWLRDVAK